MTDSAHWMTKRSSICPSIDDQYSTYGKITLRHFATMTSGYDGGGDQSKTPFTPTKPLFKPGEKVSLLGPGHEPVRQRAYPNRRTILKRTFPRTDRRAGRHAQWCMELGRLGTGRWTFGLRWGGQQEQGESISRPASWHVLAFFSLTRETGNGEQLISREWVTQATSVQVEREGIRLQLVVQLAGCPRGYLSPPPGSITTSVSLSRAGIW